MKAERLHRVLLDIRGEFDQQEILARLATLTEALNVSVNQPTPQNTQAFETALTEFKQRLKECQSNDFVPTKKAILRSINGTDKTGEGLSGRISEILTRNAITPANALTALQQINKEVAEFHGSVVTITDNFAGLQIAIDELGEGEYEIGISMPETIYNGNVEGFKKEIGKFDTHIRIFSEAMSGEKGSMKIRSIGSGSLEIFLTSDPITAASLAFAIERIVAIYEKIISIRIAHKKLVSLNVPKDKTDPIAHHVKDVIRKEIEKLRNDLMSEYSKGSDKDRKHELKNGVFQALLFLADRIDRGVDVEVSTPPVEKETIEVEGKQKTRLKKMSHQKHFDEVLKKGGAVKKLTREDEPILQLTKEVDNQEKKGD